MKEVKDFLQEVDQKTFDVDVTYGHGETIPVVVLYRDEVKRLISEAYIAGMNFQEAQKKRASNGGIQSKG